jgi:uncharacterized protein
MGNSEHPTAPRKAMSKLITRCSENTDTTRASISELKPSPVSTPASIPTQDGIHLNAEIIHSTIRSPHGLIIFVHGFCGNKYENGLFKTLAERLANEGFHSVLYDWRGLTPNQGEFGSTTIEQHAADFEQVVRWARTNFPDCARGLSSIGFSLGATVIGLALRHKTDLTRVVYISPAVRPRLSMWPRYDNEHIRREIQQHGFVEKPGSSVLLGQPILNSLRDTDLGPLAFDVDIPLLVCHGSSDVRIPCAHTRDLVAKIGSAPTFHYIEHEGASHSFRPAETHWQRLASEVTCWLRMNDPEASLDKRELVSANDA